MTPNSAVDIEKTGCSEYFLIYFVYIYMLFKKKIYEKFNFPIILYQKS